jgi:hypothetical protein
MNRNYLAALVAVACAIILLLLVGCVPGNSGTGDSNSDNAPRESVAAPIEGLDILIRESFPPGYTLHITSGLPGGCARFEAATITGRSGSTITVAVTNTMPTGADIVCTAIYGYKETNLDLGQDFVSGQTYTVKVNDKTTTFTAQ